MCCLLHQGLYRPISHPMNTHQRSPFNLNLMLRQQESLLFPVPCAALMAVTLHTLLPGSAKDWSEESNKNTIHQATLRQMHLQSPHRGHEFDGFSFTTKRSGNALAPGMVSRSPANVSSGEPTNEILARARMPNRTPNSRALYPKSSLPATVHPLCLRTVASCGPCGVPFAG